MKFEILNPSIHDNDMNLILKVGAYKAPICKKLTKYIHMLLIPLKLFKNFVLTRNLLEKSILFLFTYDDIVGGYVAALSKLHLS
jgi:hypothetical protein